MRNQVRFISGLLFCGALLLGQLSAPQAGVAHFRDGSLRIIFGVPANLLTGRQTLAEVTASSFSNAGGLVAGGGTLALLRADGSRFAAYPADEPEPLLNVEDRLTSAVAWLPKAHTIVRWNGSAFESSVIDDAMFGGRVVFVRLLNGGNTAAFYVEHAARTVSRVLVALPSGRLISSDIVPAAQGPVFLHQGWILWQGARGLLAESTSGMRQTLHLSDTALPEDDLAIERMSTDWLHVTSRSTAASWAILLTPSRLNISLLPPPRVEAAR